MLVAPLKIEDKITPQRGQGAIESTWERRNGFSPTWLYTDSALFPALASYAGKSVYNLNRWTKPLRAGAWRCQYQAFVKVRISIRTRVYFVKIGELKEGAYCNDLNVIRSGNIFVEAGDRFEAFTEQGWQDDCQINLRSYVASAERASIEST